MGVAVGTETWVGRRVARLEDEALLRGQGRFMDDLDPVPNAGHAAILRSPLAHARIASLDAAAALELPGVIGVLTGADVAALSRPFPVGVEDAPPYYAAALDTVRYAGEPVAVVVARDRYVAEDALELIEVDYEPLEPGARPRARPRSSPTARFVYGDPDGALAAADLVVEERFTFPRWSCTPVECYGVVADWDDGRARAHRLGELPGAVHAALRRGRRARASRLEAAPDHPARLRRQLRDQVGGLRLRRPDGPRVAEARRARPLDRGPPRAPRRELGLDRPDDVGARPAFSAERRAAGDSPTTCSRTSAPTSARPSRRRSTGCTARSRAPTASGTSPPATASSLTNRCPTGLNRGFGGPQLYLALERTMTIAAQAARPRPGRAAPAQPRPARTSSRTARRRAASTTRATTRAASTTCSSCRATPSGVRSRQPPARRAAWSGSASPASSSRRSRTWATSRSRRPPRSGRRRLPKSGNAEGATVIVSPLGGDHRPDRDDAAGPGPPDGLRAGRRGRARRAARGRRRPDGARHHHERVERRVRQLLVALLGRRRGRRSPRRAEGRREAADDRGRGARLRARGGRAPRGQGLVRRGLALAPPAGRRGALEPGRRCRPASSPACTRRRSTARRTSRLRTRRTASPPRPRTASSSTSPSSRSTARPARSTVLDYTTVHDAGRLLNPLLADGQVRGGFAHGAGAGALRAAGLRRGRQSPDGLLHGLPLPDRPRAAPAHDGAIARRPRRSRRSAPRGSARATR